MAMMATFENVTPGRVAVERAPAEGAPGGGAVPRIAYLELQVTDLAASQRFFHGAFGWSLTGFGPDYAATVGAGVDLGLDGSGERPGRPPQAGVEVSDLEAALSAVTSAGGVITQAIFAYPGGRRFHFREPSGNEMMVFVSEAEHGDG